jgi:hypothetical protein
MTPRRSSEELVAELAGSLEPVRPVAPLRGQLAAIAGVWAATGAALLAFAGARPVAVAARGAASVAILVALALLGGAGATIGVASRIPGRERVVRAASAVLLAGAGLLLAVLAQLAGGPLGPELLARALPCIDRSLLLALPPAAAVGLLAARGAPWHVQMSALGVALGASALGGLLVHLTCPSPDPWHWLLAHAVVPALGGLALGAAAGWLLTRPGRARGGPPRAS